MLRIFIGQAVSRKKKRKKFKMDFIEEAFKLETGIEATNHSLLEMPYPGTKKISPTPGAPGYSEF